MCVQALVFEQLAVSCSNALEGSNGKYCAALQMRPSSGCLPIFFCSSYPLLHDFPSFSIFFITLVLPANVNEWLSKTGSGEVISGCALLITLLFCYIQLNALLTIPTLENWWFLKAQTSVVTNAWKQNIPHFRSKQMLFQYSSTNRFKDNAVSCVIQARCYREIFNDLILLIRNHFDTDIRSCLSLESNTSSNTWD